MNLFIWTNDYSVKNETLDNEHKKLFDIINKLYAAFMKKETKEKMDGILTELKDYTIYHFSHEEQILRQKGTPLPPEHIDMHQHFIKQIAGFKEKADKGQNVVQYEMMSFLQKWLIDHIKGTDQKYSKIF